MNLQNFGDQDIYVYHILYLCGWIFPVKHHLCGKAAYYLCGKADAFAYVTCHEREMYS
jgi:hypothetical protein